MPHFPFNISEGRRVLKKLNARMATFGAIDQVPYLWTSAPVDARSARVQIGLGTMV